MQKKDGQVGKLCLIWCEALQPIQHFLDHADPVS